ncbi:MAG TPA: hypothetical protein VKT75_05835 [Acidobacteriaceae bacterium]|nr:hypothetical protein [Acidobacteriaceae bacterium]
MAEPGKHAQDAGEARRDAAEHQRQAPEHGGPEHADEVAPRTSVNGTVSPRIVHKHKGDVGRPETNEEIFQGFKTRELK